MGKRKRTQMKHYDTLPQTVRTKFGLREVDNIMEAWESRNLINRRTDIFSKCAIFENNKDLVDHISILPDDVLQCIISMLTMREGASTSILSSRWRNLWSSSVSCLNFDAENMTGCNYFQKKIDDRRSLDTERCRFIKWLDQILHLRQGARIDTLRICYFLGKKSSSDINRWVDLAAAQGVHKLIIDLDLTKFGLLLDMGKLYKFPFCFFARGNGSTLIHLHLVSCVFKLPRDFKDFNSLLSLSLEHTCLTGKDVRNILSNCSSLEWLSIRLCEFLHTTSLKFAAPSLRLKHLAILNCSNFSEIEVEATKLISFEYEGQAVKSSFKNVSRVVSSYLGFSFGVNLNGVSYVLNELPSNLPWLETLFLCRQPYKENILPAKLPTFTNLKRLVFSVMTESGKNLLELTSLLEACPSLQKLELDLYVSCNSKDVQTKVSRNSGSFHSNVKEIEMYGFRGYHNEIELAKCLLKYAHALEKMKVYTDIPWFYCGNGKWILHQKIKRPAGIPLKEVRKLLHKEARSTTRLIISPSHQSL